MTITDEIARLPAWDRHDYDGVNYPYFEDRLSLLTRTVEAYLNDVDNIYANSVGALDDLRAVLAAVKERT